HVVWIGRDVREPEGAVSIGGNRLFVIRHAIDNGDGCFRKRRSRGVCHRPAHSAGAAERLRYKAIDRTERKHTEGKKNEKSPHAVNHTERCRKHLTSSCRRPLF